MKTKILKAIMKIVFFTILFGNEFSGFSQVIYVNHSAAGTNNGTNWTDAFTDLTSALDIAVAGNQVWVATGVYKPSAIIDLNVSGGIDLREACFQIPSGVQLYGGFIGTEGTLNERNWETNPVILSGDIDNNDLNADGNNISEDTVDNIGNNAYHVIFTQNVNSNTRLDGFIITAGEADIPTSLGSTDPNLDGGGWFNKLVSPVASSSPAIYNSIFRGNHAKSEGGAMYNSHEIAGGQVLSVIYNCQFLNNIAGLNAGAIHAGSFNPGNYALQISQGKFEQNEAFQRGGAVYLIGSNSTFDSVIFIGNKVTVISEGGETRPGSGGAVGMVGGSSDFYKCMFTDNSATGNPTGPYEGGGGGAVYMSVNEPQTNSIGFSEPEFVSCGFYNNTASWNTGAWGGAAVHLNDAGVLTPHYINCVFAGNHAQNHGGAVASFTRVMSPPAGYIPALEPEFTNCTFTQNNANQRGGALYFDGQISDGSEVLQSLVENCILADNTSGLTGPEIYNEADNIVKYSLIEGSGGSGGSWNSDMGTDGGNNIDEMPGFIDASLPLGVDNIPATNDDGLRLNPLAVAVDAGNNGAPGLSGIDNDYIGNLRILGGQTDMGAYERAGLVIPDLDFYWIYDWRPYIPNCLSCPWSFLFLDRLINEFIWEEPAQLKVDESSALLTGKIIDPKNEKIGMQVNLKLINKTNWIDWNSANRTYLVYTKEAREIAAKTHFDWSFWELSDESYFEGEGAVIGKISVKHLPQNLKTGFQFGVGANGFDKDFGMSGTFIYEGKLKFNRKNITVKGIGTMNVDAKLCSSNCGDAGLLKNSDDFTEETQELNKLIGQTDELFVYPVPANDKLIIDTKFLNSGNYKIRLFDLNGRLIIERSMNTENGSYTLMVDDLNPGIYVIKLISKDNSPLIKNIIIE